MEIPAKKPIWWVPRFLENLAILGVRFECLFKRLVGIHPYLVCLKVALTFLATMTRANVTFSIGVNLASTGCNVLLT